MEGLRSSGKMALGNSADKVGDESRDFVFYSGMDVKESSPGSHKGGTASKLLCGFALFALELCCDVLNVFVIGFLSEPETSSASIHNSLRVMV